MNISRKIAHLTFPKFVALYAKASIGTDFFITEERPLLSLSEFPYRSAGYIIGICTGGHARVEVNLQTFEARENALLLATPFHILRIYDASEDFRCRFVVFSKDFLSGVSTNSLFLDSFSFFKNTAAPVIYGEAEDGNLLLRIFRLIDQAIEREQHSYRRQICQSILTALLYEIGDLYNRQHIITQSKPNRKQELSMLFQNLVFVHYKEHRNVQFYADRLFVTSKHLTETIKEMTGKTAGEWIDDAVVLEAKVLLRNSGMSVAQVANAIHFPDQSSFGKYFKKHTGYAPSEFKIMVNT
ncbi:helix-turn-helix domain-containing protein [Rurimicrobium arvi]|uniref:Helix-turn-helix domain-containing protein n=1 Tax=Rurimicrobium arvi TaxID=2049916 RepID=A0ABP8MJI0_9BACT